MRRKKLGATVGSLVVLAAAAVYAASVSGGARSADRLEMLFRRLDKNGDGKLTASELPGRLMLNRADTDGDGAVSLDEARAFRQKTRSRQINRPEKPAGNLPMAMREFTASDGRKLRYQFAEPAVSDPQKKYPLVVCLHGRAGNTAAPRRLFETDMREKYPCFIMAPRCPSPHRWAAPDLLRRAPRREEWISVVLEAVDALLDKHRIDPCRIYITGQSMGGFGTFGALVARPHMFAAAVPCASGWDPSAAGRIAHVPIRAFHGAQDRTVPVEFTRDMIQAIRAAGGTPEYTELKDTGHNSWTPAYETPEMWEWMFSQELPEQPSENKKNQRSLPGVTTARTIRHDGREREYLLHLPESLPAEKPLPVVFAFHGGGSTARQMERFSRFSPVADRHGFIVVYPQGIAGHWNDGRHADRLVAQSTRIDDVGFAMAVLNELKSEYMIDEDRVYAFGISNGAIFSHRLALEHSEHIAAIGCVIGSVAEPLADEFSPAEPVSVLIMKGTEDPLVPYEGGAIAPGVLGRLLNRAPRGKVVSTEREVELWLQANGLDVEPVAEKLPDTNKNDGAYLEKKEWSDPKRGVSVVLYDVVGGGHTYPGGLQYLPKALIGTTCRDADASAILWKFFESHPKSQESTGKE